MFGLMPNDDVDVTGPGFSFPRFDGFSPLNPRLAAALFFDAGIYDEIISVESLVNFSRTCARSPAVASIPSHDATFIFISGSLMLSYC